MPFEHYIHKGAQRLRMGYTTGTCAALAAKAAATMLFSGKPLTSIDMMTPKGLPVTAEVLDVKIVSGSASCAVCKDAGDDPDITDGILIYAEARKQEYPVVIIDGGPGVGRVTKPGLDQPVGAAAINSVPRRMITSEVRGVCERFQYAGGISVIIGIPEGERLAQRTFNPKLGIEGGLSILGTSGIVEPMSAQALIDCIGVELRTLAAEGRKTVVLTPGNYGEAFLAADPYLGGVPSVRFSNFAGDALDFAVSLGFEKILLVGHIGKLVKLAGGIMNTHSSVADCRVEILAAHAARAGADCDTVSQIMSSVSTDACIDILDRVGLRKPVLDSILQRLQEQLERRTGNHIKVGAILFSNVYGPLAQTETAQELIDTLKQEAKV